MIDDLKSIDPWHPKGIRIYGTADIVTVKEVLGKTLTTLIHNILGLAPRRSVVGELKYLYSCKESSMLKKQRKSSSY